MTIYSELMQRVDNGESFSIDFEKQNMKVGKTFLVKNGEYDQSRQLIGKTSMENIISIIEELYHNYKYSLPSERSDKKRRKYFKALGVDELTDRQLMTAVRREGAQARLEGFLLCTVLSGQFTWTNDMPSWFWQSKNDPDLVILRKWIKNN